MDATRPVAQAGQSIRIVPSLDVGKHEGKGKAGDSGTFSVPARTPNSWLPPTIWAVRGVPERTYNAPTPLGP